MPSIKQTAPDLKSGNMINGKENLWITEIQSALFRTGPNPLEAYLSHECRMERLPFSETYLGGGTEIFQRDKPWEFLAFKAGGKFYQSASPAFMTVPPSAQGDGTLTPAFEIEDCQSKVHCPDREITIHGFTELHALLLAGDVTIRDLFLRVQWQQDGDEYTQYSPCRYVNFSNPDHQQAVYIQPISGSVLFPVPDGLVPAYVACALHPAESPLIEFACRAFRDGVEWRIKQDRPPEMALDSFRQVQQAMPSYFLGMDHIVALPDARADIYSYC